MTKVEQWWLSAMRSALNAGTRFHRSETWPEAAADFNESWASEPTSSAPPVLVVHPLAEDPATVLGYARRERDHGVASVYSVLHEHPLSKRWHGHAATWAALRELQDLGHEIALLVDPYRLADRYDSVEAGIDAQLEVHRDAGLDVRSASLFSPEGADPHFGVTDFFAESAGPGDGDSPLAAHRGATSLAALATGSGLERWADPRLAATTPMFDVRATRQSVQIDAPAAEYRLLTRTGPETYDHLPIACLLDSAARVSSLWSISL